MKKAVLSILLCFILCACSSTSGNQNSGTSGPAFKIGHPANRAGGPINNNARQVVETAGGEWVVEINDIGDINAIRLLIDKGCDGIMLMPTDESILPQVAKMCDEAEVYWAISMRPIIDAQVRRIVESSEYFVGLVKGNDDDSGYSLMKLLGENGNKHTAVISVDMSDPVGQALENGLYRAASEYGMGVVAEIRDAFSSEDTYSVVSDIIIAYPELDSIFRVAGHSANLNAIIQAVRDADKADDIQIVSIGFAGVKEEDFIDGAVLAVTTEHQIIDPPITTALLVNAVMGTPISPGAPLEYTIDYIIIRTCEEYKQYSQFTSSRNNIYFTSDDVRNKLLKTTNEDLTAEDFQKIIDDYNIDRIIRINSGEISS